MSISKEAKTKSSVRIGYPNAGVPIRSVTTETKSGSFKTEKAKEPQRYHPKVQINTHPRYGKRK